MREKDSLHRFIIESADVRGSLVSLDASWLEARGRVAYPELVQQVLGQAFAASVLLATTIKFEGKMTLQIRGDGPVHLLVVQVTADQKMRGLARWTELPAGQSLSAMFGDNARMTITIEAKAAAEPYQGIVALQGESLTDALRDYFTNSEQLDTEIILAVNAHSAVGLLVQKLPDQTGQQTAYQFENRAGRGSLNPSGKEEDTWNRTRLVTQTLSSEELLTLSAQQVLQRIYQQEQVRLFKPDSVAFACSCSKGRTDGLIQSIGFEEAQSILREQGDITITCEFCDEVYRYDSQQVAQLFAGDQASGEIQGPTLH